MTVAQGWLLVGIPAAFVGILLFASRSRLLGSLGLLVLLAAAAALAMVDPASAAALGALATLLYASGRAGAGAVDGADPVRPPAREHRHRPPTGP